MSKCEHCGHDQDQGRFCDACGRMLKRVRVEQPAVSISGGAAPAEQQKCQRCGAVQSTGRFCDSCGMKLDGLPSATAGGTRKEEIVVRCPECGSPSRTPRCGNCGIWIRSFPSQEE